MNHIFYAIIYGISLLPMRILYLFSWFLYILSNYIIGYRRKVIYQNLKNSFPKKSETEIKSIQKKFYKNFADYLIETLKAFSIQQKTLDKRYTYSNLALFEECKKEGKNVMLMTGHIFNWEWYIGTRKHLPSKKTVAIYHHIYNRFWNEKINNMRSKFGTISLEMKKTARYMLSQPNDGDTTYLFIADQSPKRTHIQYDINFLNQQTPVFSAFDKIARKLDMAIIYCNTVKTKQGYYHTTFERITPKSGEFEEMEIVDSFFEKLETTIQKNPDNWLWSHKRWKYKKGIDY
ncbi:MAG: lysophospholipid acyltransferase family protein [Moheibacter sp.]